MAEKVSRMDAVDSDTTFESVLQSQASNEMKKLQTSKIAGEVDVPKKYINEKYKKSTVDDLFEILKEEDLAELQGWRTLTLISNFNQIRE